MNISRVGGDQALSIRRPNHCRVLASSRILPFDMNGEHEVRGGSPVIYTVSTQFAVRLAQGTLRRLCAVLGRAVALERVHIEGVYRRRTVEYLSLLSVPPRRLLPVAGGLTQASLPS